MNQEVDLSNKVFLPPLALNFIWHPEDVGNVQSILDCLRKNFSRDKDKPFSREINLPLFFYSSQDSNEIPASHPELLARHNLIFIFTSINTLGIPKWKKYIEGLVTENTNLIPVAIDKMGLKHNGSLSNLNCIRAFDWDSENKELSALLFLSHEICRFGIDIVPGEIGGNSSVRLFISHAKSGDIGRQYAEQIKRFIDETNMKRFFDANEISPGFKFDEEIEKHIECSTFLAIENDTYSSRYWCQKEILSAKKFNRPMIAINCLSNYEDRVFPGASNIPRINVGNETPLSSRDILRVLSHAMIETIRHRYSLEMLEVYKAEGWIDQESELIARPLEIRQSLDFIENKKRKICYPDPPIYIDESDWHEALGVDAYTPLWSNTNNLKLQSFRVGISISDIEYDGFVSNHLHSDHLTRLLQDISRHLLSRSAVLLYGGDLRQNGFTEFILEEAIILRERLNDIDIHIENHLAWPLYISSEDTVAWRAKYSNVMKTKEYNIPDDVVDGITIDSFLPPSTPENLYVWSRCLTEMRERLIESSQARICVGGQLSGYKGKMPGVLEEILIAHRLEKPLFLLGAFGGVVGEVCNAIIDKNIPETLSENWQVNRNNSYYNLQKIAKEKGNHCNYESIGNVLKNIGIEKLSQRSGLEVLDYKRLMLSPFTDECVHLIIKGISNLQLRNN